MWRALTIVADQFHYRRGSGCAKRLQTRRILPPDLPLGRRWYAQTREDTQPQRAGRRPPGELEDSLYVRGAQRGADFISASSDFKALGAFFCNFRPGRFNPSSAVARVIARSPFPPATRRAFPVGASPFCRPIGTGLRKSEILSAFCAFSRLCKAKNFPLGRDAEAGCRASGVRRRPETTTFPIVARPDAFSPRHRQQSAGRCARLVPAI
jgi:hypothetical protein